MARKLCFFFYNIEKWSSWVAVILTYRHRLCVGQYCACFLSIKLSTLSMAKGVACHISSYWKHPWSGY